MPADPTKLVHPRERTDDRPIFDDGVPSERDAVRQDRVIAHLNVMRDVCVCHDEIVVADRGHHSAALGAAMNRNKLADLVAMPDACSGAFALVL